MADASDAPLSGTLVVDLSRVLAGPYCTMHLADMGAEVIKIERPGVGDDTRGFGPPFKDGVSTYFLAVNRGKQSIELDLKDPGDRALVRRMLAEADVVVENFRPGTMAKLGLDWPALQALNPRLIYASVAGYGAVGGLPEYTARPGYDLVAQGMGGVQSVTGHADGPPTKAGVSIADLTAGLYCFQGILLALLARQRTGRGQRVDISMQDCQAALLTYHGTAHLIAGEAPQRLGNAHPSIVPYEAFPTADGYINIAAANQPMFERLCDALGVPHIKTDPKFVSNATRVAHRTALFNQLAGITATIHLDALVALLTANGVVAGPILEVGQVLDHPQVRARGMVVSQDHPTIGPIQTVGCPIALSNTPAVYPSPPPLLGQHNAAVRARFGPG